MAAPMLPGSVLPIVENSAKFNFAPVFNRKQADSLARPAQELQPNGKHDALRSASGQGARPRDERLSPGVALLLMAARGDRLLLWRPCSRKWNGVHDWKGADASAAGVCAAVVAEHADSLPLLGLRG